MAYNREAPERDWRRGRDNRHPPNLFGTAFRTQVIASVANNLAHR